MLICWHAQQDNVYTPKESVMHIVESHLNNSYRNCKFVWSSNKLYENSRHRKFFLPNLYRLISRLPYDILYMYPNVGNSSSELVPWLLSYALAYHPILYNSFFWHIRSGTGVLELTIFWTLFLKFFFISLLAFFPHS